MHIKMNRSRIVSCLARRAETTITKYASGENARSLRMNLHVYIYVRYADTVSGAVLSGIGAKRRRTTASHQTREREVQTFEFAPGAARSKFMEIYLFAYGPASSVRARTRVESLRSRT